MKQILILLAFTTANAASCYGFGDLFGTPDGWLRSDLARAKETQAGNNTDIYVSEINFFFEGNNLLQFVYKSRSDLEYQASGWVHGVNNETDFFSFQ